MYMSGFMITWNIFCSAPHSNKQKLLQIAFFSLFYSTVCVILYKKRTSIYKEDTHFVKGKEGKRWFNNRQKKKCWSSLLKPKAFSEEQSSSCSWGYLLCIVWVDYILVYQRPIYVGPLCDKILKIVHTLRLGDNSNG